MGAPAPELNDEMQADSSAEGFTSALRTISPPERRKHASVYNYWLSIKRDRQFPPIRDLDPLEISDAGPYSLLLEMVGGGEDAGIRHIGQAIKGGITVEKIAEAPNPSLLSCIAARLPVVAGCRDAFAFEDEFETADGKTRCWVTLLPFSATGSWIDYVYGFVTLDSPSGEVKAGAEPAADIAEAVEEIAEETGELPQEVSDPEPETAYEYVVEDTDEAPAAADATIDSLKPTISEKFFEKLANIGGFYGRPVEIELDPDTVSLETWEAEEPAVDEAPSDEPIAEPSRADVELAAEEPLAEDEAPAVEEPLAEDEAPAAEQPPAEDEALAVEEPAAEDEAPSVEQPTAEGEVTEGEEPAAEEVSTIESYPHLEGTLETKLTEVRAKADEARQAKLRANSALYQGLSAAYDFALDAEDAPEEYLKLVQAEGLKIQLRSPMKPVAKLAFDGMCDDMTIQQLEAILAWAFDEELPRGTLAERIEEEGGIAPILNRQKAA
jgi:hypothetical protein